MAVDIPEAHTIVTPGEEPRPATADDLAPDVAVRERKMPFKSKPGAASGHVLIEGTTYWYRAMDDPRKEWAEDRPAELAKKYGLSLEDYDSNNFAEDTPANRRENAKLPVSQKVRLVPRKVLKQMEKDNEETCDYLLDYCLVDWDWDFPVTAENKRDLFYEHKTGIMEQVNLSTRLGMSQSAYFLRTGRTLR